jgi:hypothetical protein
MGRDLHASCRRRSWRGLAAGAISRGGDVVEALQGTSLIAATTKMGIAADVYLLYAFALVRAPGRTRVLSPVLRAAGPGMIGA